MPVKDKFDAARKGVAFYGSEQEAWKSEHEEAMVCRDVENVVSVGVSTFDILLRVDFWHRRSALSGEFPFSEELDSGLRDAIKEWTEITARLLSDLTALERRLYTVQRADELRSQYTQAVDILTPDDEFFGEELVRLQEVALDEHRAGQSELVPQ